MHNRRHILLSPAAALLAALLCTACAGTPAPTASAPAAETAVTETTTAAPEETTTEPETTAAEETTAPEEAGPKLLFEDEFDGDDISPKNWERAPEWERGGGLDQWDQSLSWLDGEGHLVLHAEWDTEQNKVRSGAVRSIYRYEGGLGYYEASIKFPVAYGTWGAFWMMVGYMNGEDGSSVDGCEIDIVESANNEIGNLNQAIHWDGYGDALQSQNNIMNDPAVYDGEFHTFGLWRTEKDYRFYVDGKEVWVTEAAGVCTDKGYMKLTMEAAEWAGAGTPESIESLPADMVVDYVRVWDTKPE